MSGNSVLASLPGLMCAGFLLVACGQGNEPLSILGDPNARLVDSFALPYNAVSGGVGGGAVVLSQYAPFVASNAAFDGIDFVPQIQGAYQVLAPGTGVVTEVDSASITILHNVRVSSRLSKLSSTSVRVGDYVTAGSVVGATTTTGVSTSLAHLSVFVDGAVTCPYSYLVLSAKALLNQTARTTGLGPCNE